MPISFESSIGLFSLLLVAPTAAAASTPLQLTTTFTASDAEPGDNFGSAVELEGGLAVIRSRVYPGLYDSDSPSIPNQTHLFRERDTGRWEEVDIITLSETVLPFGEELALDNGEVIIGMSSGDPSLDATFPGSLDFFGPADGDNDRWSRRAVTQKWPDELTEEDLTLFRNDRRLRQEYNAFNATRDPADRLARYVDADNGYAIASFGDTRFNAALLYERTDNGGWRESHAFLAPDFLDFSAGRSFGNTSVAINGTTAAVSASSSSVAINGTTAAVSASSLSSSGSVVLYELGESDWGQVAVLDLNQDFGGDFGRATLALSEDTLLVRDWLSSGEVLVYERHEANGWEFKLNLTEAAVADNIPPEFAEHSRNGWVVPEIAIEGDLLAITANGSFNKGGSELDTPLPERRRVNLYRRDDDNQWVLDQVLFDPEPEAGRQFGSSLAIDDGRLLIGAESDLFGTNRGEFGAAYLYSPIPEPTTVCLTMGCICWLTIQRRGWHRQS